MGRQIWDLAPCGAAFALWLVAGALPVLAQTDTLILAPAEWITVAREQRVKVRILDGVKDGCWTNSQASKTAVELELIRSGFKLDERAAAILTLTAAGYKTQGMDQCVVSASLTLSVPDLNETRADGRRLIGITTYKTLYSTGAVMTNTVSDTGDQLKGLFVDFSRALLVHYAKQVQEITEALQAHENKADAAFWLNWMNTPK